MTVVLSFDMMGKRLYKMYHDVSNIVVRVELHPLNGSVNEIHEMLGKLWSVTLLFCHSDLA